MHNPVVKHEHQLHQVRKVCVLNTLPHPLGNLSLVWTLLIISRDVPKFRGSWTCCPTWLYVHTAKIFAALTDVETVGFWHQSKVLWVYCRLLTTARAGLINLVELGSWSSLDLRGLGKSVDWPLIEQQLTDRPFFVSNVVSDCCLLLKRLTAVAHYDAFSVILKSSSTWIVHRTVVRLECRCLTSI